MHCFLSSLFSPATARATVAATSDGPRCHRRSARLAKDEALDRVFAASDTVAEAKVAVAAARAELDLECSPGVSNVTFLTPLHSMSQHSFQVAERV